MHRPATFAALLGLTRAASAIGDFWAQSDYCAQVKGATDEQPVKYTDEVTRVTTTHGARDGARACAWHCLTYTATQALAVGVGARLLGIRLHPGAAATAALLSGATHYIADRRVPDGIDPRELHQMRDRSFVSVPGLREVYWLTP